MWTQRVLWVAWPGFLAACLLELVVFAFADPADLHWSGHALELSRQAVYTAAFFGGISQVNAYGSVFSAANPPGAAMWYL